MLERGEVGGRVILADTAFVVAEDHVQHPMQAVLDGPVATDNRADQVLASMVTMAPSIASTSRSFAIAIISFDFSATLVCPRPRAFRRSGHRFAARKARCFLSGGHARAQNREPLLLACPRAGGWRRRKPCGSPLSPLSSGRSVVTSCHRWRSHPRARRSARRPRKQCRAGISQRRAPQKYRRGEHERAFPRERAGTGGGG